MFIDLHTHTTASDGSMTPKELVQYAKTKGLAAVAITDHDTVEGVFEALEEGKRIGIEVLPGVEIGVESDTEMHILGYFSPSNYEGIIESLGALKRNRDERNPKIVSKLNEIGFHLSIEEVQEVARGGVVGRPHIAKVMLNKGYVKSISEAFALYLADGKVAYFKKDKLTPNDAIQEILKNKGVPVLAHPIHLRIQDEMLDKLLERLSMYGLKGIECFHVDHTEEQIKVFLELAEKYNLIVTGGSDFHGTFKTDIDLGSGRGDLKVSCELLVGIKSLFI